MIIYINMYIFYPFKTNGTKIVYHSTSNTITMSTKLQALSSFSKDFALKDSTILVLLEGHQNL